MTAAAIVFFVLGAAFFVAGAAFFVRARRERICAEWEANRAEVARAAAAIKADLRRGRAFDPIANAAGGDVGDHGVDP